MKKNHIVVSTFIVLLVCSNYLYSWDTRRSTLKNLALYSPIIVVGNVDSIRYKIEHIDKHQAIFTYVSISPQEIIKGTYASSMLTIKIEGGRAGNFIEWSSEGIPFSENETVLLFLYPHDKNNNLWKVVGVSGKHNPG